MRFNKKSQTEHIDEIFALLVFLLFIFLGITFINYFYKNTFMLTINSEFIEKFYNHFKTEIQKEYYFISSQENLGYDIIEIALKNKSFDVKEPYVVDNYKLYILKEIKDRDSIEITYFDSDFENRSNIIPLEFSCLIDTCRIPKAGILYGLERNLLNYIKFYDLQLIKYIQYKQDKGAFIIQNESSKDYKLFYEFYAENPLLRIKSSLKNLNSKMFIDFYLLQPIPYSDVELNINLLNFSRVTTARFLKYLINYERAYDLNETICFDDETKYVVFYFNFLNKEYSFIIASPSFMNITICYDYENLTLNIKKRISNHDRITFNIKESNYDFNLDTYQYSIKEGMPIKKTVLSQRKIDQYFKLKPDLGIDLQFRDIIVTDENGKYIYTFGKETLSDVKVETFVEKMLLDMENFTIVPVYLSFLEWKE